MELEEDVKIYLEENYERINVPVPQFGAADPQTSSTPLSGG